MNITISSNILASAEKDIESYVILFMQEDSNTANQIAKEIVQSIDWTNSTLMHKGLSWITKTYLLQQIASKSYY